MKNPNISDDGVTRKMTDEEYATLLADGWTDDKETAPTAS
jgi:hypothetical protein